MVECERQNFASMCTVTWLPLEDGYEVFCNRDELKTRKPALPPAFAERNGVRALAPIDADGGGSWLGVNELGVSLCLVNHYPLQIPNAAGEKRERGFFEKDGDQGKSLNAASPQSFRSRGLLLTELLDCVSPEVVATRLEREMMGQYRPFILLVFGLLAPFRMFVWNGETMLHQHLNDADLPVTSSSFETEPVIGSRWRAVNETVREKKIMTPDLLVRFHRSHLPERSAYSVCMHRDDAATVSCTHLRVSPVKAELRYLPHAPCSGSEPKCFSLSLEPNENLLAEGYQARAKLNAETVAESLAAQMLAMELRYE